MIYNENILIKQTAKFPTTNCTNEKFAVKVI